MKKTTVLLLAALLLLSAVGCANAASIQSSAASSTPTDPAEASSETAVPESDASIPETVSAPTPFEEYNASAAEPLSQTLTFEMSIMTTSDWDNMAPLVTGEQTPTQRIRITVPSNWYWFGDLDTTLNTGEDDPIKVMEVLPVIQLQEGQGLLQTPSGGVSGTLLTADWNWMDLTLGGRSAIAYAQTVVPEGPGDIAVWYPLVIWMQQDGYAYGLCFYSLTAPTQTEVPLLYRAIADSLTLLTTPKT